MYSCIFLVWVHFDLWGEDLVNWILALQGKETRKLPGHTQLLSGFSLFIFVNQLILLQIFWSLFFYRSRIAGIHFILMPDIIYINLQKCLFQACNKLLLLCYCQTDYNLLQLNNSWCFLHSKFFLFFFFLQINVTRTKHMFVTQKVKDIWTLCWYCPTANTSTFTLQPTTSLLGSWFWGVCCWRSKFVNKRWRVDPLKQQRQEQEVKRVRHRGQNRVSLHVSLLIRKE